MLRVPVHRHAAERYQAREHADRVFAHLRNQGMDELSARMVADAAQARDDGFQSHLSCWEAVLHQRVAEAVTVIVTVPGVAGLILAGSLPRGEGWPLSDIDLVPVYAARLPGWDRACPA